MRVIGRSQAVYRRVGGDEMSMVSPDFGFRCMVRVLTVLATFAVVLTIALAGVSYRVPIAFTFHQDSFGRFLGVRLERGWGILGTTKVVDTANPRSFGPTEHSFFVFKLQRCAYPRDFLIRRVTNETGRQFETYQTGGPELSYQGEFQGTFLSIHCIVPLMLTTMLIYLLLRGPIQRRRYARNNQCVKCGYSVTGNITGVCPECGRVIQEVHASDPDGLRVPSSKTAPSAMSKDGAS